MARPKKPKTPAVEPPTLEGRLAERRAVLEHLRARTPASPDIPALEEEIEALEHAASGAHSKTLKARALADWKRSGLTQADWRRAKCLALSSAEAQEAGYSTRPGYLIPYHAPSGKLLDREAWRLKYLDQLPGAARYGQLKDTLPRLYYPPGVDWSRVLVPGAKLVLVEGEKKALAAARVGLACVGIGGVWNWRAKKRGLPVLPDLEWLLGEIAGGELRIVFDSDAVDNPDVAAALAALSQVVVERGVTPWCVQLPAGGSEKVGLDDYLLDHTREEFDALPAEMDDLTRELHAFNAEFAVVRKSVGVWSFADSKLYAPEQFKLLTDTRRVTVTTAKGVAVAPISKQWLEWRHRREHHEIVFEPGAEAVVMNGHDRPNLNIWVPTVEAVKPKRGDLDHYFRVRDHVLAGSEEWIEELERWLAYPHQHPGAKLYTALVLHGVGQGTGKTLLLLLAGSAYGKALLHAEADALNASFNSQLVGREFVLIDEVISTDRRRDTDRLKSLVTKETLTINEKFAPEYQVRNCLNFAFTSNHPNPIHIESGARRFFVLRANDSSLAAKLGGGLSKVDEWLRSGRAAGAMLHYWRHLELGAWSPRQHAPVTTALEEMAHESRSTLARWLAEVVEDPRGPHGLGGVMVPPLQTARTLAGLANLVLDGGTNEVAVGRALAELGVPQVRTKTARLWVLDHAVRRGWAAVDVLDEWQKQTNAG